MRTFFRVVARIIAGIFAIFFVITAVMAIWLYSIENRVFSPNLYKTTLEDLGLYQDLPMIVGEMVDTTMNIDPCSQNPVTCENVSAELKSCYERSLENGRYIILASGSEEPTEEEKQAIQLCVTQWGAATEEESGSEGGPPYYIKNMKASDWQAIVTLIFPPEDLKVMVNDLIDQVFSYLNGDVESASISMVSLKQNLLGSNGKEAIKILLRAQPLCSPKEAIDLVSTESTGEDVFFCNPPESIIDQPMPDIDRQVKDVVIKIPDTVTILKPAVPSETTTDNGPLGGDIVTSLHTMRTILKYSIGIPILFLLLVTLFAVRSFKSWMRWWGIPFFFAGLVTIVIDLIITPLALVAWLNYVDPQFPTYFPAELAVIGKNLAMSLLQGILQPILFIGAVICILGLGAWIGSYFIKSKKSGVVSEGPTPDGT